MNRCPAFRPLNWDCNDPTRGCYKDRCVVPFDSFADCLSGKASFSDLDMTTERNGHYLVVEWKASRAALGIGQRLYLERQPPQYLAAVVICPDFLRTDIRALAVVRDFRLGPFRPCCEHQFRAFLRRWEAWALCQPTPSYLPRRNGFRVLSNSAVPIARTAPRASTGAAETRRAI